MQLVVQVRIFPDHLNVTGDDSGELIDIATIDRDGPLTSSTVAMSIAEAKQILAGIDDIVVSEQAARATDAVSDCAECGRPFASKDTRRIVMRSLYGTHRVESPRWWTCPCEGGPINGPVVMRLGVGAGERSTFSPLTKMLVGRSTPELALVEAKLAAHMSYPAAAGLLEELFATGRRIHRSEICRTVEHLAERLDSELGGDEFNYMDPRLIDRSTVPDMPMTATLDGGYVHSSNQRSRRDGWFQAVCGTVTTHDGTTRRFGFVPGTDATPRSRIRAVLDAQGLRQDQMVTFLTDGAEDLAGFCEYMNYTADYVLDWFHIAMRFTVLANTTTNVVWTANGDDDLGDDQAWCDGQVVDMREQIGRAKWFLWHGNHRRALQVLDDVTDTLHGCDDNTARTKSLKMIGELVVYLERNQHRLPSHAERHLAGEPISSAPAESAVNQVIAKRMVKKQQMRWTPAGAHRLLQIRTRVLDGQLDNDIARWHPTTPPIAA